MSLKVEKYETRAEMGKAAATGAVRAIKELLAKKEEINIVFAAAPSQNELLSELVKAKEIDWGRVNAFHMDEYIGLKADAPQRFGNFLGQRIFSKLPFKTVNYISDCKEYAGLLAKYPPDMVCMGIGENGHIAFNDPHVADFNDKEAVKIVELDEKCRTQQVNDGCFDSIGQVPTHAITLTIPTLVNVDYIICTVPSPTKAEAVFNTLNAEISEKCPATILRNHQNAVLYIDVDSGALLA